MVAPEPTKCPSCGTNVHAGARFCGACGSAMTAGEMTDRVISGKYKILSKLGEGGMGAVYRAEQISVERPVALKLLKPELSNVEGLVRRFNAEAKVAAKLNHPNTVTLFDFGQEGDGSLFIVMELVKGRSLRQLISSKGAVPVETSLFIAEQVCASLADAHEHGIIHRDLKPDNVMLTVRGRQDNIVRVLDFGIAKLRDDGRTTQNPMTQAGDLLGTPQYMAPEQIRGEKVDARTDVYAMGCMLYEMLTGKLPFTGKTVMAILGKHLTDAPEPMSKKRPGLAFPADLEQLILQCMQKDQEARPPSMEVLGDRIALMRRRLGIPTPHSHSTLAPVTPPRQSPPSGRPAPSVTPLPLATPVRSSTGVPTPSSVALSSGGQVPAPTPAFTTAPTQRTTRRRWPWALLVLLLAAGGGVGVYFSVVKGDEPTAADFENHPDQTVPANFETKPERPVIPDEPPEDLPTDFNTKPNRNILGD